MQSYGNNRCGIGRSWDITEIVGVETVSGRPWTQKKLKLENRAGDDEDEGDNIHEKQGCTPFIGFGEHCEEEREEAACTKLNREYYGILDVLALDFVDITKGNVNGSAIRD